jgi:hypothetical protein
MTWKAPYNGGNAISSYVILFGDSTGTKFYPITSYCDGSSPSIVSQRYCDIPFTTLRAEPFKLVQDQLVTAKLAAKNIIGTGAFSPVNTEGVTVQVDPLAPLVAPISVNYTESYAQVVLTQITGSLTGSAQVLFYELSWDMGTNGYLWSPYTVTSGLQVLVTALSSGQQYRFRYRAQNIHGWGPYSPVLTITAMIKPSKVQPVIVTYEQENVKISWIMPYNGGLGIPITSYDILIKKKDGSLIRYLPNCDGNSTTVVANR